MYINKYFEDYDYYVKFIKEYCENDIVDAATEVIGKELKSNFKWTQIYSAAKVKNIYYHNDPNNKIEKFDIKKYHRHKIDTTRNLQSFFNKLKVDIFQVCNVIMWDKYCCNFVNKYNFAVDEMNNFIQKQQTFNPTTFIALLKFWWRCSTIASTLHHFNLSEGKHLLMGLM